MKRKRAGAKPAAPPTFGQHDHKTCANSSNLSGPPSVPESSSFSTSGGQSAGASAIRLVCGPYPGQHGSFAAARYARTGLVLSDWPQMANMPAVSPPPNGSAGGVPPSETGGAVRLFYPRPTWASFSAPLAFSRPSLVRLSAAGVRSESKGKVHSSQTGSASASGTGPVGETRSAAGNVIKADHVAFIRACFSEALVNEAHLAVGPTRLPLGDGQRGLFAKRKFEPNQVLVEYRGTRVTKAQLDAMYGQDDQTIAPYSIALHYYPAIIDASDPATSSIARFANDCRPETIRYMQSAKTESDLKQPLGNNA